MTNAAAPNPESGGGLLTRLARLLFDEETLSAVVHPAIADFEHELREAGTDPHRRIAACWRGARALCALIVLVPFSAARSPVSGAAAGGARPHDRALLVVLATFFASSWSLPPLVGFSVGALISGFLLAVWMRRWHDTHPGRTIPSAPSVGWRGAEINLASIHIADNAAGLIPTVGGVVIFLIGLPQVRVFFAMAVLGGLLLACALSTWRTLHGTTDVTRRPFLGRA